MKDVVINEKPDENSEEKPVNKITNMGTVNRQHAVQQILYSNGNVVVGRKHGVVDVLGTDGSLTTRTEIFTNPENTQSKKTQSFIGFGMVKSGSTDALITCTNMGNVSYKEGEEISQFNISQDSLLCMRQSHTQPNLFATGGQERDLHIWNIEKSDKLSITETWKAKNVSKCPLYPEFQVKNDSLDLRVPVWINDIQWKDNFVLATATEHHQVRLYDTRTARRPVFDYKFGDSGIKKVVLNGSNELILGNAVGELVAVDTRAANVTGKFHGITGSITDLEILQDSNKLVTCGVDRFLRVYDLKTRNQDHKVYLKQRLTCLTIDTDYHDETGDQEIRETEETEELWESLETAEESRRKRRKEM